jgi:hypothetical protein
MLRHNNITVVMVQAGQPAKTEKMIHWAARQEGGNA